MAKHPTWVSISADIFAGQIIAALIVLTFVAIFLLREWISQNARPGLFEDDEVLLEEQPPPAPIAPEPQPQRQAQRIQGFPGEEDFNRRQAEALRALDALRGRREEEPALKRRDRGPPLSPEAARQFRRRMDRPDYERRVKTARDQAVRRRVAALKADGRTKPAVPLVDDNYDFTFKAEPPELEPPKWLSHPNSEGEGGTTFFPPVTLQPPRENIPYSISHFSTSPPWTPDATTPGQSGDGTASPRRPTLPASTITMANNPNAAFTISPGRSPMSSPGLATYHPPEELREASTPQPPAYFDPPENLAGPSSQTVEELDARLEREALLGMGVLSDSDETEEEDLVAEHEPTQVEEPEELAFFDGAREDDDDEEDDDEEAMFFVEVEEAERQREMQAQQMNEVQGNANGNAQGPNQMPNGMEDGDFGDDMEGNVEDDMEGALEGTGNSLVPNAQQVNDVLSHWSERTRLWCCSKCMSRCLSPLWFSHSDIPKAALMVFVLETAIGLCILIPYTIGKTTALLVVCRSSPNPGYTIIDTTSFASHLARSSSAIANPSSPYQGYETRDGPNRGLDRLHDHSILPSALDTPVWSNPPSSSLYRRDPRWAGVRG